MSTFVATKVKDAALVSNESHTGTFITSATYYILCKSRSVLGVGKQNPTQSLTKAKAEKTGLMSIVQSAIRKGVDCITKLIEKEYSNTIVVVDLKSRHRLENPDKGRE